MPCGLSSTVRDRDPDPDKDPLHLLGRLACRVWVMATCRNLPTASQVRKFFFIEYVGKQCRAHKLNKNVAYPKNRNSYVTKEIFTHRPRRLQKNTCSEVLVIPLWLFGKYIAYSGGHRFICISFFKKDNPATQDTRARGCCEGIWSAIFTQKALFLIIT